MAYREVRMMDIEQVVKRWLNGEKIRAVARATGLDRNTVRRLIRFAEQAGLKRGDAHFIGVLNALEWRKHQ